MQRAIEHLLWALVHDEVGENLFTIIIIIDLVVLLVAVMRLPALQLHS